MNLTPVRVLAPTLLVAALALAGCSGADDSADGDSTSGSGSSAVDAPAAAAERGAGGGDADVGGVAADAYQAKSAAVVEQPSPDQVERSLIRHGNVALGSQDVGAAQFAVQKVVDQYGGQVTEEKTTTDDDGNPAFTRMVLRIPVGHFTDAMDQLKHVGVLETANTSEDDVTTQVIDTRTRLHAQQRSIARITTLFDRAESIRDIMAIEAQLTRRQADLDSLERQAAYLAGQTTLSTITVSIDQIHEKKAAVAKDDDSGFVAGLSAGWSGLTTFAVGVATVAGALLPWLVVVAMIGVPVLLLVRTVRRRRTAPPAGPTPEAG